MYLGIMTIAASIFLFIPLMTRRAMRMAVVTSSLALVGAWWNGNSLAPQLMGISVIVLGLVML